MKIITLTGQLARRKACQAIQTAPENYVVRISEKIRSLEANSRMWACLTDISEQVDWYGNKLSQTEWKDVFSASLKRQKVVPGLETGSFVVCGQSTSKMTKSDFSDLLEVINAFAAEQGVVWSDMAAPLAAGGANLNQQEK